MPSLLRTMQDINFIPEFGGSPHAKFGLLDSFGI
jgi:hypothetical protein